MIQATEIIQSNTDFCSKICSNSLRHLVGPVEYAARKNGFFLLALTSMLKKCVVHSVVTKSTLSVLL